MKLEVQYPVLLKAVPPRSANVKTIVAMDSCAVDIPEYSGAELPVVIREIVRRQDGTTGIKNFRAMGTHLYVLATQPVIENGRVEYGFAHDDRAVWSSVFHDNTHREAVSVTTQICKRGITAVKTELYPDNIFTSYNLMLTRSPITEKVAPVSIPSIHDLGTAEDIVEGAREGRRKFLDHMKKVILVDGKFMIRRQEPILKVDAERLKITPVYNQDMSPDNLREEGISIHTAYFAVDDEKAANDFISETWRHRQDGDETGGVERKGNSFEVLDPSVLTFDGAATSAWIAAETMIESFTKTMATGFHYTARRKLDELGLDCFIAYKRLADAASAFEGGEDADELCEAARRCLSNAEEWRFYSEGSRPFVELALERWENRPVDPGFGLAP